MKIKSVKILTVCVMICLFATQAWAADWIGFASNNLGDMYYDKSAIKKENKNIINVMIKQILSGEGKTKYFSFLEGIKKAPENSDKLHHVLVLQKIDCTNKKFKSSSIAFYDEKEGSLASQQITAAEWNNIMANTPPDALKNILCGSGKTSKKNKK